MWKIEQFTECSTTGKLIDYNKVQSYIYIGGKTAYIFISRDSHTGFNNFSDVFQLGEVKIGIALIFL